MKICTKCLESKDEEQFPINRYSGNRREICSLCLKAYNKAWREKNRPRKIVTEEEKLARELRKQETKYSVRKRYREQHKEKVAEQNREWRERNKERCKENNKAYYQENRETFLERNQQWKKDHPGFMKEYLTEYYQENKEAHLQRTRAWQQAHPEESKNLEWKKKKRQEDLSYRIECNLRSRLWIAIRRQGTKKLGRTLELLGCTKEELRSHLEKQFRDGMSWNNYGSVWQIDHIRACASFDLANEEEQRRCFHYTNLQPLLIEENKKKGDK